MNTLKKRELEVVIELQQILQEIGAPAPASLERLPAAVPATSDPSMQEVLAGLGYLVALQNSPRVGDAVPGPLGRSLLNSLLTVIREWLVRKSQDGQKQNSVAGFYRQASEHVQRLRTTADAPTEDGKEA